MRPDERTPEQIQADIEWLRSLRETPRLDLDEDMLLDERFWELECDYPEAWGFQDD